MHLELLALNGHVYLCTCLLQLPGLGKLIQICTCTNTNACVYQAWRKLNIMSGGLLAVGIFEALAVRKGSSYAASRAF